MRALFVACLAVPVLAGAAVAQAAPQTTAAEGETEETVLREYNTDLIGTFDIDTSIPESPGFAAIGVEPASVLDPGVEPITYAALTQFLDEDNNLKSGFALGGTPYWWGSGRKRLWDYRNKTSSWERIAARATISAAFADGGESKTDKLGFGVKTDLLDSNDYRLDKVLYKCVADAYAPVGQLRRPDEALRTRLAVEAEVVLRREGNSNPSDEEIDERSVKLLETWQANIDTGPESALYEKGRKKCQADASKRYAVKRSLIVAAGMAVNLDNGDASDWEGNGGTVWMAYRQPLRVIPGEPDGSGEKDPETGKEKTTQPSFITVFGKYGFDQTEKVQTVDVKSNAAVVGLVGGYETSKLKLAAQLGYKFVDYDTNTAGLTDDDYSVYSVGVSYRLNENLWLKVDAGETGERKAVTDKRNSYLKISFAYDLG